MKSKDVFKSIIQKIIAPLSSEHFFEKNFNVIIDNFEQFFSIPFNATIYTKLMAFQFKINHNILYTDEKLHKVKLSDTQMCTFCNDEIETLLHLFIECNMVTNIWQKVIENLLQPFGVSSLTKEQIVFGVETTAEQNEIINHIILEVKYYIYVCKLDKCTPTFQQTKNRLRMTEDIEKRIAIKAGKITKHIYKWNHLTNYLLP